MAALASTTMTTSRPAVDAHNGASKKLPLGNFLAHHLLCATLVLSGATTRVHWYSSAASHARGLFDATAANRFASVGAGGDGGVPGGGGGVGGATVCTSSTCCFPLMDTYPTRNISGTLDATIDACNTSSLCTVTTSPAVITSSLRVISAQLGSALEYVSCPSMKIHTRAMPASSRFFTTCGSANMNLRVPPSAVTRSVFVVVVDGGAGTGGGGGGEDVGGGDGGAGTGGGGGS